jgi:hypothetical protein
MGMDIRDMGCSDQCVLVLLSLVDHLSADVSCAGV